MNVVAKSLYGIYRPVAIYTWCVITVVVLGVAVVTSRVTEIDLSIWRLIVGEAVKYWLLVLGTLLVATHLKLYVANGVTRREFLAGAGAFGILTAVVYAALVPIGTGVEWLLRSAFGIASDGYPDFTAGEALRDFGFYAPVAIGFLVTGALVAAGFYRYPWWAGLLLIIPFALPLVVSESLLGLYVAGDSPAPRFVPLGVGVLLSLLVSAAGAAVLRLVTRDVPIRPSAG
jgi:hypothetical protein